MVCVVVAKYKEDVSWTQNIKHKVIIYDKSDELIPGSIQLYNVGREAETFLYHIVNNYHNLDDVTVFLQGNPFDHVQLLVGWRVLLTKDEIGKLINKINTEITSESDFSSFYQVVYNDPAGTNGTNTNEMCLKYYGTQYNHYTLSPGAQYIVPKKYILSRPYEFWKRLHAAMYNKELSAHCQEQLWYLAFRHRVNDTVGNHDFEKERCLKSKPSFSVTPISYFVDNKIEL